MKGCLRSLLIVLSPMLLLAVVFWADDLRLERRAEKIEATRAEAERGRAKDVAEYVAKFGAIANWSGEREWRYTWDAQEALRQAGDRPLFVEGELHDVGRVNTDDPATISYRALFQLRWSWSRFLDLEVTEEQAASLASADGDSFLRARFYLVFVVKPPAVRRPLFQATTLPISSEEADLIVDASESVYVISGRLVDARPAE